MSGDMPLVLLEIINFVLGPDSRADWDDECLNLEINNFEICKRACLLWRRSRWLFKRVAVAANSRAEGDRARALAQPPQPNTAATMAMSLEQPLTVEAPVQAGGDSRSSNSSGNTRTVVRARS